MRRGLLAILAALCFVVPAHAAVTFDWATVGDPGNAPDQLYADPGMNPDNLRFGAVDYTYRISKHEVTNDQYTEFLNAVDAMGTNPNSVYTSSMGSEARGGIAFNAGAPSGSKYSAKLNMGNKPVIYVSFFDAMRFVNWLENGQPTDGNGTETGVYSIGSGLNETRGPGATFFIPSEDEWYKAAYYQPAAQGGDTDNYWLYPTASNAVPTVATANSVGDISDPGINVANYARGADWNGVNGNVTTVGSAGPGSASFYGTFDQGGNVYEFNEAVISWPIGSSSRGERGGAAHDSPGYLTAAHRTSNPPAQESGRRGFRVASIPELESLMADFDGDGDVDGDDFLAWQTGFGIHAGAQKSDGDYDNDGDVDGDDFLGWQTEFGSVGGSASAAVPEPTSILMLFVVLAAALCDARFCSTKCRVYANRRSSSGRRSLIDPGVMTPTSGR